jgi:hypothetical protein
MDASDSSTTWDAFISYASEDRESVAQPLAEALRKIGLKIWFDQTELRVGDSLRERIDAGLANSRYGIVVLSPSFFAKHYPVRELNGLAQREVEGQKVILPIWNNIGVADVRKFSLPLADRIAISWGIGLDEVVARLFEVVGSHLVQDFTEVKKGIQHLAAISGGVELVRILQGAYAQSIVNDEFETTDDLNTVGDFLQVLEDWTDAIDEAGAGERAKLALELTTQIRELETGGWKVFGGQVSGELGRGLKGEWPIACVAVVRANATHVVRSNRQFMVLRNDPSRAVI